LHHRHKYLGRSNHSIYICRHISTSGDAQFVAERAQMEILLFMRTISYVKVTISLQKHWFLGTNLLIDN